jgi:hypothetical protein
VGGVSEVDSAARPMERGRGTRWTCGLFTGVREWSGPTHDSGPIGPPGPRAPRIVGPASRGRPAAPSRGTPPRRLTGPRARRGWRRPIRGRPPGGRHAPASRKDPVAGLDFSRAGPPCGAAAWSAGTMARPQRRGSSCPGLGVRGRDDSGSARSDAGESPARMASLPAPRRRRRPRAGDRADPDPAPGPPIRATSPNPPPPEERTYRPSPSVAGLRATRARRPARPRSRIVKMASEGRSTIE